MALAGMGAIADALSDVALGYTEGLLKPNREQLERERELKLQKQAEEIATAKTVQDLNKAQALHYGRPQKGTARPIKVGNDIVWVDETGAEVIFKGQPDAPKYDDIMKGLALKGMEDVIGRPHQQWTTEDKLRLTTDDKLIQLMDIYSRRSDLGPPGAIPRVKSRAGRDAEEPAGTTQPTGTPTTQTTTGGTQQPAETTAPPPKSAPVVKGEVRLGKTTPEMEEAIAEAHQKYPQVRTELIRSVMRQESSYNPYVRSPKGAEGLMQLMPGTGREMGVTDPFDVRQNVLGGTRYLDQMLKKYGGSEALALAAYNAGPGRFDTRGRDLSKMSEETRTYVPAVLQRSYQMRWEKMAQADVEKQWQVLNASTTARPEDKEAGRQAYKFIFGKEPPGIAGTPAVAPTAPSVTTGTAAVPPVTKTDTTTTTAAVPPVTTTGTQPPAPAKPTPPTETQAKPSGTTETAAAPTGWQPYRSWAQKQKDLREQQTAERQQEQLQLQKQGLTDQQQEAKLRELDRQHDRRMSEERLEEDKRMHNWTIAQKEKEEKKGNAEAVARLNLNLHRATREQYASIEAADETIALIKEMQRYVEPATVGFQGKITATIQSLRGQFEKPVGQIPGGTANEMHRRAHALAAKHLRDAPSWQAEENLLAAEQGRTPTTIYVPPTYYNPKIRFLDFLKEVIAYSHARAINGPGRLTDQDLNRAARSLGIDSVWNSAADVQSSLAYVEKIMNDKKTALRKAIAGVEGRLKKGLPGTITGEPEGGEPAEKD